MSRYGGKNRTMKQWYEGKAFPHGARTSGFALNKRALGQSQDEIYSQFSADQIDRKSQDAEVLSSLKNNEFFPKVTFDSFLAKKLSKGKRTMFLNRETPENAREHMQEYMAQSKDNAEARAMQRIVDLDEERKENQILAEQVQELNEILHDKKVSEQEQNREHIKQGIAEKAMYSQIQKNFDKQFGFNAFPYTHGDNVEKAQGEATRKWREELVEELEKKKEAKTAKGSPRSKMDKEAELLDKAYTLTEAKGKFGLLC